MHGDKICELILKLLNTIDVNKGTPEDVEKIRNLLNEWDEYADYGDDR